MRSRRWAVAGAKREFEAVRNVTDLPPVARDALGRRVAAIDEAVANQNAKHYSGYLESSVGYDTNVNAGPSDQTLLIPALAFIRPATISPQAMPKKSAFYEITGGFSGMLPIDNETALFADTGQHPSAVRILRRLKPRWRAKLASRARFRTLAFFRSPGIAQTFLLGGQTFRNITVPPGGGGSGSRNCGYSLALSWLRLNYPNIDCTSVPASLPGHKPLHRDRDHRPALRYLHETGAVSSGQCG